ncbi:hypothetical protein [Sphingomonas sp. NPDC092410]|uniref:hypothetical protein n=1 Tax=unclassified Sphingomonas TaxID=196159 RepID=UPI003D017817
MTFGIFLIGGEDDEQGTLILHEDRSGTCRLTFRWRDRETEAEAADYFEAFCGIRRVLETEGLIPFCYGASLNVYPSAMARDMGRGLKAYRITEGKHARREDLVFIFGQGPDVIPAGVDMQRRFFDDWVAAPRA